MHYRLVCLLILIAAIKGKTRSLRGTQQSCECTPWLPPKCTCHLVAADDPTEMLCTCTPSASPKCLCGDREISATSTTPFPSINVPSPTRSSTHSCQNMCSNSCMNSCSRLSSNSQCLKVCTEACDFSCAKQEKTSKESHTTYSEYKFILPVASPSNAIPIAVNSVGGHSDFTSISPPPIQSLFQQSFDSEKYQTLLPALFTMSPNELNSGNRVRVMKSQPMCIAECMPDCTLACTTVKEALALLRLVVDNRQSTTHQCENKCADSCSRICVTTGLPLPDCLSNCAPTCQETCSLTKPPQCIPRCLPDCVPSCLSMSSYPLFPNVLPNPSSPIQSSHFVSPQLSSLSQPLPSPIAAACKHECSVQCDSQCGVQSVSGPSCLSSCQTTCYPVCVQKMRRKPMPKSTIYNGY